jgi:glycosyltransferase involved in cell wall biosynthesis
MLRVCHIISGDLWAGAEVMASNLLGEMRKYPDLELSVILLNDGRLAEELRTAGLPMQILDERRLTFLGLLRATRAFLRARSPNIIHSHRYKENLIALFISRALPGTQLVTTQHGLPEANAQSHSLAGKLISFANFFVLKRYYKRVVAVSRDLESFFVDELGFSTAKVGVIHNGVEIPPPISRKSPGEPFLIGSSGRLFPVKDYPLMVDMAKAMAGKSNVRFALAGEGPERGRLEADIQKHGLADRFHLRGHLDDMETFYQGLDLYLNTSLHEGIPMTILEAMAQGLPVVAPRVGGIPEVIEDGVEGFLIDGRDPRAFAEKCLSLAGDKELWSRMSLAARKRAMESFSVERMTEQYLQVYRDVVAHTRN